MKTKNTNSHTRQSRAKSLLCGLPPALLSAMLSEFNGAFRRCNSSLKKNPEEVIAVAIAVATTVRLWKEKLPSGEVEMPKGFEPDERLLAQIRAAHEWTEKAKQDHEEFATELEELAQNGQAEWNALGTFAHENVVPGSLMHRQMVATGRRILKRIELVMGALSQGTTGAAMWQNIPLKKVAASFAATPPTTTALPEPVVASLLTLMDPGLEELAVQALRKRDWLAFFLKMPGHGNGRLRALIQMVAFLSDSDYWHCVRAVWSGSDITWPDRLLWRTLFTARAGQTEFMTPDELAQLENLPDEVTVYRGFAGWYRDGISWTLSREMAEFFAEYALGPRRGFRTGHPAEGASKIVSGRCRKSDLLALNNDREEQEIIVFPEHVHGKRVETWHAQNVDTQ